MPNDRTESILQVPIWLTASRLATVIQNFGAMGWDTNEIDIRLRRRINAALDISGLEAVIAFVPRFSMRLSCATPRSQIGPKKLEQIVERAEHYLTLNQAQVLSSNILAFAIDEEHAVTIPLGRQPPVSIVNDGYCGFVMNRKASQKAVSRDERQVYECQNSLRILFSGLIRRRARLFGHFPPEISQLYWEESDSLKRSGEHIKPPWENTNEVHTTTLAFDLRKSTFCMNNAADQKQFARWTDKLVQALTKICHRHGGVYDKFTGDGILAHFLERECQHVYGMSSIRAALSCGVDMLRALEFFLPRMRRLLRFDCDLLGGGVGIDVGSTFWSVDHKGNPLTVGEAVVGACRLCDSAQAQGLRLTNIAFQNLKEELNTPTASRSIEDPQKVVFKSKEYAEDMKVLVWEYRKPPWPFGSDAEEVRFLCE